MPHLDTLKLLLTADECYNKELGVEAPAVLWTLLWFAAYEGDHGSWPWERMQHPLYDVLAHLQNLGLVVCVGNDLAMVRYSGVITHSFAGADAEVYRDTIVPALQAEFPLPTPTRGTHFFADSFDHAVEFILEIAPHLPTLDTPQGEIFPGVVQELKKRKTKGKGARSAEERMVVSAVFEDWQKVMGYEHLKLTDPREDVIIGRYRAGYSIKQMQMVGRWVANDDWMRGRATASTRKYDDLVFYMDNNKKFEKYLHQALEGRVTTRDGSLHASDAPVNVQRMK